MSTEVTKFNPQGSAFLQIHPKLGHDLMQHLWDKLDAKYPGSWRAFFKGSNDALINWKETWAETFEREGLTPKDIKTGLDNVMKICPDFPPNEGQFLKACKVSLSINFESAFYEAVDQLALRQEGKDKWSNPAIYWAATRVSYFDMMNHSYDELKGRWAAALQSELDKSEIHPVPEPRLSLPKPGECSVTNEQARENIRKMREMLSGAIKKIEDAESQS